MHAVKHKHVIFSSLCDTMLVGLSFFEKRGRILRGRIVVGVNRRWAGSIRYPRYRPVQTKMAASNVKMIACQVIGKHRSIFSLRRLQLVATRQSSTESYTEEEIEFQKRLKRLRDASGLDNYSKSRLNGTMPYFAPDKMKSKRMTERKFHRQLYSRYGMASGKCHFGCH